MRDYPKGLNHHNWKGGRVASSGGYVLLRAPDHPRSSNNGYVLEHVVIAEQVLGKLLPAKACVHHADEKPTNNEKNNLVICQDAAYHRLLHLRLRALKACGNPAWRKCKYCNQYDDPSLMYYSQGAYAFYHRACHTAYKRARKGEVN